MSRKSYFHPVLAPERNDYVDESEFSVEFSCSICPTPNGDKVLIACNWLLNNKKIKELLVSEEAKVILTAYCPDTMKRFCWTLDEARVEIEIPIGSVIGFLNLQAVVVTTHDIDYFIPIGANPEFGNSVFALKQGLPLATSAEKSFLILTKQRKLLNMIRVQKSENLHPDVYEFILSSNAITILMGARVFTYWNLLNLDLAQKPHLFLSIYKDALVEAIRTTVEDENTREYLWAEKLIQLTNERNLWESQEVDYQRINQIVSKLLAKKGVERILLGATED